MSVQSPGGAAAPTPGVLGTQRWKRLLPIVASVITGNRPSGTLPTSRATANTTASETERPATSVASGTNAAAVTTAISAISHATLRT